MVACSYLYFTLFQIEIMKKLAGFILVVLLTFVFLTPSKAQASDAKKDVEKNNRLIADYYSLDSQTIKLNSPISKAYSKISIADGLWRLDAEKAKQLLLQALELTFPENDEKKVRGKEISRGLFAPSKIDISRKSLQTKIFHIALRDNAFSKKLIEIIDKKYVEGEKNINYSKLAKLLIENGDLSGAESFITLAIETGQIDLNVGYAIYLLSAKDRVKADELILKLIDILQYRRYDFHSLLITLMSMEIAIFADDIGVLTASKTVPSSDVVIKKYLDFALNKVSETGQIDTNGFKPLRGVIVSLWRRIIFYAPELENRFRILEQQSRLHPNDEDLPEPITPESQQKNDEAKVSKAEESKKAEDIEEAIKILLRLKKFSKARELANLFKNEKDTEKFSNQINTEEAIYLIENKNLYDAEKVMKKIGDPRFVLKISSILIEKFYEANEKDYAQNLTYETVRKLKSYDENLSLPYSLSQLTKVTAKIDKDLTFTLLDETIKSLNKRDIDEEIGEVDFDVSVFPIVAKIDIDRSEQMAENLSNNLRRIIALAAVYQFKVNEFKKTIIKQPASNSKKM